MKTVTLPPRNQYELRLPQAGCPMCRQEYPEVKLTWCNGGMQRMVELIPFAHNTKMSASLGMVCRRLRDVVLRLNTLIPTDPRARELMARYVTDGATAERDK